MKTDFEIQVHVDLGVTPELVALVTALIGRGQKPEAAELSASEQPARESKPRRGRKAAAPEQDAAPAPEPEQPEEAPAEIPAEVPGDEPQPEEPKELTEQNIREAMHLTRQRIEGEDYKDNPDGEGYKLYHRLLTQEFKNIASLLGAEKPSALPAEKREAFITECGLLEAKDGKIVKQPPF